MPLISRSGRAYRWGGRGTSINLGLSGPIEERRLEVVNARDRIEQICGLHLTKELIELRGKGGGIAGW